jgi:hypothetical protein
MKNYKLFKLRVAKTGLVFGVNKFGHRWIEFWWRGKFKVLSFHNLPERIQVAKLKCNPMIKT